MMFTPTQPPLTWTTAPRARSDRAQFVIGLGGGSALDCAKAIAAVAPGNHAAADYVHQRAQPGANTLPVIAIPTTAGTGSEMNRSCMITDPGRPYKGAVRSDHLFPRYAVVDPLPTHSAGRELTAQTGFDALAHAVESYVSPRAQPICDALALQAIQDVAEFLPVALANPHHARAREKLSLASTTMGINLSLVGTCLPHRLDKPLCALHPEISHGQSVALFYPCWAMWSHRGNVERFARVTEILDPATRQLPIEQRDAAFAKIIAEFLGRIDLGQGMRACGIQEWELSLLAQKTEGDLSVNPVPFAGEELREFLAEVYA
jgi:alcohol dehydrogenase class IV